MSLPAAARTWLTSPFRDSQRGYASPPANTPTSDGPSVVLALARALFKRFGCVCGHPRASWSSRGHRCPSWIPKTHSKKRSCCSCRILHFTLLGHIQYHRIRRKRLCVRRKRSRRRYRRRLGARAIMCPPLGGCLDGAWLLLRDDLGHDKARAGDGCRQLFGRPYAAAAAAVPYAEPRFAACLRCGCEVCAAAVHAYEDL
mmetsp:Transcript_17660/g.54835  ORF Transcript_17660/g.54835 Transcript_17660/m.54835 type:complete len:200 (-) Transcript_17660:1478-2077(-)